MTDETKAPEETTNESTPPTEEAQPETHEEAPAEETPADEAPPVAGEPAPPVDLTILGALTPQENAMLMNLRRQSQQLVGEIGKIEIQKSQYLDRFRATDEQSQSILMGIGQRLGIPDGTPWTVGGDGNARTLPPQMLQQMQGMQQARPRPAATASQPPAPQGDGKPSKEE